MPFSEADTHAKLVNPAIYARGWTEDHIKREETTGAVDIIAGKARRRAKGRTDLTLRVVVTAEMQPVAVAVIEVKKDTLPPGHGLDQAKGYAKAARLNVPFVFSTNGYQFVEFDRGTGQTTLPRPMSEFPGPSDLRTRYEARVGFTLDAPAAKPLLQHYKGGEGGRRYYQDAAIRAVLEKVARDAAQGRAPRALLSLATGAGKTFIAANLLRRVADAGQLRRALFLCDRDELRRQALGELTNYFGDAAREVYRDADGRNHARNAAVHVATYQTLGVDREGADESFLTEHYAPSITKPYRWTDWARPIPAKADKSDTNTRRELTEQGAGKLLEFVNTKLIPTLKKMRDKPDATPRQRVIAEILSGVERVRIDTETNLLEVLDKVHEISQRDIDATHVFALSQIYEGLLLKMGEKGSDAGQFFTPREVIRAMVRVLDPHVGERIYDPCCGTGGFLAQAAQYLHEKIKAGVGLPKGMSKAAATEQVKHHTFYGREKENLIYPIGLANLILHGIDDPHIWHGNTLTGHTVYDGLFKGAPSAFEVILTNPPFGGKENPDAIQGADYKTSATEVLFLQRLIRELTPGGRCGVVLPEGVLFRTNEDAFTKTKKKLLEECDLWCVVSLPGGVFTAAGAGVKTNLLFFTRGKPTEKIWYYDLSDRKVGKKTPLTLEDFKDFFEKLPSRADSEKSWTLNFTARRRRAADDARRFRKAEVDAKAAADLQRARISTIKQASRRDQAALDAAQSELDRMLREARDAASKAQAIEDAVYDLKAVNPNRKTAVDTRTPTELLDLIEAKGREVADALATLRSMG